MKKITPLTYEDDVHWRRFSGRSEKPDDERSPAEVDRSRVIHSGAFRRLLGKTQVFGIGQDDFFRTRLTHSLEVAQIAKGIALRVGADFEVCEAAALAHDIGHPPFGHKGEAVLSNLMLPFGGFEANAQNFRILAKLEPKFADESTRGLDLTRAVLDALLKYREPFAEGLRKFYYIDDLGVAEVVEWAKQGQAERPVECEIMDWADDIAYSVHDLEDGIHAGMISAQFVARYESRILDQARRQVEDCDGDDLGWAYQQVIECEQGGDAWARATSRKSVTSKLINEFLDVGIEDQPRVPYSGGHGSTLDVPPKLRRHCQILKSLAFELLIDDPGVASLEVRSERILQELFDYFKQPKALRLYPETFRTWFQKAESESQRARVACDFISGMTDAYAERVYSRMFTPIRVALGDY